MADVNDDQLRELRPSYLRRLKQRIGLLEGFALLLQNNGLTTEALTEIHRTAHSMGSSSAIYGYNDLSVAARQAEATFSHPDTARQDGAQHLNILIEIARSVQANCA